MSAPEPCHAVFNAYIRECSRIVEANESRSFSDPFGDRQMTLIKTDLLLDSLVWASKWHYGGQGIYRTDVHSHVSSALTQMDLPAVFRAIVSSNAVTTRKERSVFQNNLMGALMYLSSIRERSTETADFVTVTNDSVLCVYAASALCVSQLDLVTL
jgi:hypothetical protein